MLPKSRFLGYIFVADTDSIGLTLTTLYLIGRKDTEFGDGTQNNGHYAVQGHSRSPILAPVERSCATAICQ